MAKTATEKILRRFKGLREQMHEGEEPLYSIPVIWENATQKQSNACDLILTNQRLFGYIFTTFPRTRLFLDDLDLEQVQGVTTRVKDFDVVFRELLVKGGGKTIYIRAPRKKIEELSRTLRATIAQYTSGSVPPARVSQETPVAQEGGEEKPRPILNDEKQVVKQTLERSPLGITILLTGGILLEIVGAIVWFETASVQTGLPLFLAGIIALLVAALTLRQLRQN